MLTLVPVERLAEVAELAVDGYLAGLDTSGAGIAPTIVRRGVQATGAAKYAAFGPSIARSVSAGSGVGSPSYDVGGSLVELLDRWRPMLALLVEWGERALDE